jgi:hypothetical protein
MGMCPLMTLAMPSTATPALQLRWLRVSASDYCYCYCFPSLVQLIYSWQGRCFDSGFFLKKVVNDGSQFFSVKKIPESMEYKFRMSRHPSGRFDALIDMGNPMKGINIFPYLRRRVEGRALKAMGPFDDLELSRTVGEVARPQRWAREVMYKQVFWFSPSGIDHA